MSEENDKTDTVHLGNQSGMLKRKFMHHLLQKVTPNLELEDVCSIAGKIEMVMYPPGAGGDFFCCLMAMAHEPTLRIMIPQTFTKEGVRYHKDIPSDWYDLPEFGETILKYNPPNYHFSPIPLLKTLEETIGWFNSPYTYPETVKHMMATTLLNYARSQRIYPRRPGNEYSISKDEWIQEMKERLGEPFILNPSHQMTWSEYERNAVDNSDRVWTTLNISPKTEEGIGVTNLAFQILFDRRRPTTQQWDRLEGRGDVHFPFMDHMVNKDFDKIIDFGLTNYSKDLNIPFMERELGIYYKHRVEPILRHFRKGWEANPEPENPTDKVRDFPMSTRHLNKFQRNS